MQVLPNTPPPVTHYNIGPNKVVLTLGGVAPKEITYLPQSLVDDLLAALKSAIAVASQARVEWDNAPSGMKAGKLLIALSGDLPKYRADIDAIHAAIAKAEAAR